MKTKSLITLALALSLALLAGENALAGNKGRHGHEGQGRGTWHEPCAGSGDVADANNADYAAACGSCHLSYRPDLLPRASWAALLGGLDDHFGQAVSLDEARRAALAAYLGDNAADSGKTGLGRKVTASLGGAVPMRLSEVPLIVRKHHGAIAGKSCSDCHK